MKKINLVMLSFGLLISNSLIAQTVLAGKWNVAAMTIAEKMYVSVEKDSIYISPAMMEEFSESEKMDSTGIAMVTNVLKTSLVQAFSNMYYVIDADGNIYSAASDGTKGDKVGKIDAAKKTISFTEDKAKEPQTIPLEYKDGRLKLLIPDKEEPVTIWVKKIM